MIFSLEYFLPKFVYFSCTSSKSNHDFFSMALPAHSGPRPLIQFRNHFSQTVGLLGRMISPSQGRYLKTGQHKHTINAYTHRTSMPASERAKTVHALDLAATVIGSKSRLSLFNHCVNVSDKVQIMKTVNVLFPPVFVTAEYLLQYAVSSYTLSWPLSSSLLLLFHYDIPFSMYIISNNIHLSLNTC
jgi:hypothetical protein